jgi:hypothetical protein
MYNVSADPMELSNLYCNPMYTSQQSTLAALLAQQCGQKRLQPSNGTVPGQPSCVHRSVTSMVLPHSRYTDDRCHPRAARSAMAFWRSAVSNPSVNQW